MGKAKQRDTSLESLVCKIEGLLDKEIDNLPNTIQSISPEKRIEFISKTLPIVVKYRESHSGEWSPIPVWEER